MEMSIVIPVFNDTYNSYADKINITLSNYNQGNIDIEIDGRLLAVSRKSLAAAIEALGMVAK